MANRYTQSLSPRRACERQYLSARSNLLLVIVFTAINLLLLVTNSDMYFLFSASIPYYLVTMGMYMCGRFPAEYYGADFDSLVFLDNSVFVILLVISISIIALYLLTWFMSSKNRCGWLIFALVLFTLDTVGMLLFYGLSFEAAFDILFHAWVIYYLVMGIKAHNKLKTLPPDEETGFPFTVEMPENAEESAENTEAGTENALNYQNSPILRPADMSVKHRVLLQATAHNLDICYRRVKRTNELVINGNVYAEMTALVEFNHTLSASVSGHDITAGLKGKYSIITVDGNVIAKQMRLY